MKKVKSVSSMSRRILKNFNLKNHHVFNKTIQKGYATSKLCFKSNMSNVLSAENVLSPSNKKNCIALLSSVKPVGTKGVHKIKKAAVLVPICQIHKEVALLYIIRSKHLKVNGGDVAFPGGMLDDTDENVEATALRETYEEIGIVPSDVEVWGKIAPINRRNLCVTPVVGYVGHINVNNLKINPGEVSDVFPVSLEKLSSRDNFRATRFRFKSAIYSIPVYLGGEHRIWGLTAYITHLVLSCLIPEYYKANIQFNSNPQPNYYSKRKK